MVAPEQYPRTFYLSILKHSWSNGKITLSEYIFLEISNIFQKHFFKIFGKYLPKMFQDYFSFIYSFFFFSAKHEKNEMKHEFDLRGRGTTFAKSHIKQLILMCLLLGNYCNNFKLLFASFERS